MEGVKETAKLERVLDLTEIEWEKEEGEKEKEEKVEKYGED
jgi:hypothetical protein